MRMTRQTAYLGVTAAAILVLGGVATLSRTDAESVLFKRVALPKEWRDALWMPAGQQVALGTIPDGGVLRLGVLEESAAEGRSQVHVIVAGKAVHTFESAGATCWKDERIDLSAHAGAACEIAFDTRRGCWVAPVELYSPACAKPNVLVFLIDTLRLDHVGCYGYTRATTPHIDAFAREAVRFTQLVPSSSWTRPSVASLLTSTYPNYHGGQGFRDVLRDGLPWLPEALRAAGHECHAFVTNPNVLPRWGFGPGFFRFVDVESKRWRNHTGHDKDAVDAAIATLRHAAGRPWFLFVHTIGPHMPYAPPKEYAERFLRADYANVSEEAERNKAVDLYDGEIAYTDAQFGRLIEELKALGEYENTIIVVLSDHGEEFWEHGGTNHAQTLYEEVLRVPLLVKAPGRDAAPRSVHALVEMVDIAPTVLDIVGAAAPTRFQGRSFRGLLTAGDTLRDIGHASLHTPGHALEAAKTAQSKYILNLREETEAWYDLVADAPEKAPQATPIHEDEPLALFTKAMLMDGAHGLHVAVVGDPRAADVISGRLEGEVSGRFEWLFPGGPSRVVRRDQRLTFEFDMRWLNRMTPETSVGPLRLERRVAHLYLPTPSKAGRKLTIDVNGKPIAAACVRLGPGRREAVLQETELDTRELVAPPEGILPAALPDGLTVYAWFVAPVEPTPPEELDEELRDALQAMGYF